MEIGFVGLEKMGQDMVLRLLQGGHRIVAFGVNEEPVKTAASRGAIPANSLLITMSLLERFGSRQKESFSAKVIAALRNLFGGHPIRNR